MNIQKTILIILLSVTLFQCNNNTITDAGKLLPNDPFKNTIVPSQAFEIDSKQDNVVEGENGTVIVCPKGCFKNAKGEIVEDNVQVELSEALSLEDMLLSNLTTTSNGSPLETDGMIYFNATADGEQLSINKDNPIHIEIPTSERKPGMMAYKGIRDEKGNMNWVEPKELDNYLVTVDINSLDFLPERFQLEVDKGMPYKNHKTATPELTDSLYYNLSVSDGSELQEGIVPTKYNEAYYNKNKKIVDGKYTDDSYTIVGNEKGHKLIDKIKQASPDSISKNDTAAACGIDPAIIKVIKSEKYQNTLIATREFETRLKTIFRTCENPVLEIYINNLDKNLYELDSMAGKLCSEFGLWECAHAFYDFSDQRLTRVKEADKYAKLLKGYYEKHLAKVKAEMEKNHEKVLNSLQEKNEDAQKVADDYKKLLWKREKYRMETYSFNWTETGWINIDNGTIPKTWGKFPLEITVSNGKDFDRVYTYAIYTSIKSLYRLNSTDNVQFYAGNDEDKEMLMPDHTLGIAVAIGYKNEYPSIAIREFETAKETGFLLELHPSTVENVKKMIRPYESYGKENRISKDLEFMAKFYLEEQRQKELKKESEFILRLWNVAFPCCGNNLNGEELFESNCRSCHSPGNDRTIGPGLASATSKYSQEWLNKWTINSQALIQSGDQTAINLFKEYNSIVDPSFNLSGEEIKAIYNYIDQYNNKH